MSSARPPFDDPTQRLPPPGSGPAAPHPRVPAPSKSSSNGGAGPAAAGKVSTSNPAANSPATTAAHPPATTQEHAWETEAVPTDPGATVAIQRPAPSPADASMTIPWHQHVTGPVAVPAAPVRRKWRKILARTLSKAWADSLFGMSSQAAFWCALSTAPLLLALLGMIGYVVDWYFPEGTIGQVRDQILLFLNTIFNQEVANNLVGNTVETIVSRGQADVVSIGLLISLWAGSSAMSAFVESITIAYNQHEFRHPVIERLFALGLYVVALGAGIVMLPLLAIGPDYLPKLFPVAWQLQVKSIVDLLYYPVLAVLLILMLTILYKVAPRHKHPWYRGIPGALLAAAVFIVASFGLRLYLAYVYSHGLTYGALATPITFLLFYYFVSMAIIIGAQFNNAMLEYYPPRRSRRELKKWRRYDPDRDREDSAASPDG